MSRYSWDTTAFLVSCTYVVSVHRQHSTEAILFGSIYSFKVTTGITFSLLSYGQEMSHHVVPSVRIRLCLPARRKSASCRTNEVAEHSEDLAPSAKLLAEIGSGGMLPFQPLYGYPTVINF